ncbi:MAG: AAA family ATPase, partial [Bernardetiaceae bacterium]|nr:AAA family ATPase [Bernardetiaceae bacterium]
MAYTDALRNAINIAQSVAKQNSHGEVGPPHMLWAVLHNDVGLASLLASIGKDVGFLREWAEIKMEGLPRTPRVPENPAADAKMRKVMEMADLVQMQLGKDFTDPLCVLAALLKPGIAFTVDELKAIDLTQKEVLDAGVNENKVQTAVGTEKTKTLNPTEPKPSSGGGDALYKYCTNKTALALEGKLDPIIGRDRETRMVAEILGRRTKPNVIIVGEPGVGKTALVDGFALLIAAKKVPPHLQEAQLFELDLGALVAGASYKGEVEERLKGILKGVKQFGRAILFVDELHVLLDPQGSVGTGASQLLKPELARGEITMIGATTN